MGMSEQQNDNKPTKTQVFISLAIVALMAFYFHVQTGCEVARLRRRVAELEQRR